MSRCGESGACGPYRRASTRALPAAAEHSPLLSSCSVVVVLCAVRLPSLLVAVTVLRLRPSRFQPPAPLPCAVLFTQGAHRKEGGNTIRTRCDGSGMRALLWPHSPPSPRCRALSLCSASVDFLAPAASATGQPTRAQQQQARRGERCSNTQQQACRRNSITSNQHQVRREGRTPQPCSRQPSSAGLPLSNRAPSFATLTPPMLCD